MDKAYSRINWKNSPNTTTPLNDVDMNQMDVAINTLDNRIIDLNTKYETLNNYQVNAASSATAAKNSATSSASSATLSKSWAVGGTSSRSGEDSNNSKYYAQQAASSATSAKNYASQANTTVTNAILKAFPVGSIYLSVNSTNPSTFIGGTWTRIQDRFLLAAGTSYSAGATGGEATHTLTTSEMPSHSHNFVNGSHSWLWGTRNLANSIYNNSGDVQSGNPPSNNLVTSQANYCKTVSVGGGSAHNNMPPYLAVYVWKRTA